MDADIYYDSDRLKQVGTTLIGTGPATLPSPEDCLYDAQTLTVGVWLHLVTGGGYPGDSTLRFELMQWKKLN